jgi:hypothetical protein
MKKGNLLASTALVSAALVMGAGSAHALSLKLGGYAEFWAGYADNESQAGVRNNLDVKHDAEIYFQAEEKLDNGLTVGFTAELEAGPGNDLGSGPADNLNTSTTTLPHDTGWDEMFAYVKGNFGQMNIGNNDHATGYVGGVRTVGPVGIFKSDAGDWLPGTYALNNTDVDLDTGDAQNVTYFTPRVGGVQLIVSYAPDDGHGDWAEGSFDRQETFGPHHIISGAARFNRKFGAVGVGLAAGYTHAEAAEGDTGSTLEGYTAAADIRFGPARVTAAYAFEDLAGRREDDHWGASAIYQLNKVHSVSLAYAEGESLRSATRTVKSEWLTLGWEADMGKGVTFGASAFMAETDAGTAGNAGDNDGWGVVGGVELRF